MPTIDYGSITVQVDDDYVEVFFPFEHGEMRAFMKNNKGRFNGGRKSWIINPSYQNKTVDDIIDIIESFLWKNAPKGWKEAVDKLKSVVCVTKKFEIKFAAAGVRITLPDGHVGHWELKSHQGAGKNLRGLTWTIPSYCAPEKIIKTVIQRMIKDDQKAYFKAVEPYVGRSMKGALLITPEEADELGLVEGNIVFANFSFLKAADDAIVDMPLIYWPLFVKKRRDGAKVVQSVDQTGSEFTLVHPSVKEGYTALRKKMTLDADEGARVLDKTDVTSVWQCRQT